MSPKLHSKFVVITEEVNTWKFVVSRLNEILRQSLHVCEGGTGMVSSLACESFSVSSVVSRDHVHTVSNSSHGLLKVSTSLASKAWRYLCFPKTVWQKRLLRLNKTLWLLISPHSHVRNIERLRVEEKNVLKFPHFDFGNVVPWYFAKISGWNRPTESKNLIYVCTLFIRGIFLEAFI
jgi:hypothetical protein